jgi:branched-chain amino acid transport system permease protein
LDQANTVGATLPARTAPAYDVGRGTPASRIAGLIALGLLAVLVAMPFWGPSAALRLGIEMGYYLALAQLWNLLAGYTGIVSIGQQAYVGLGAYALLVLTVHLGFPPMAALLCAGFIAAGLAAPTAMLIFRLRGHYLAIGTWVVAEVWRLTAELVPAVGAGSGMSLPASVVRAVAADRGTREMLVYWTALGLCVFVMALVYLLLRSRHGLALTAIRDSERASESLGVDNRRTKFIVYIVTAFATGLIGALIFLRKVRITPESAFSVQDWTAFVIFIVVIGGIGTIEGPIIGVIIFFVLRELLADFGTIYLIVMGGIAVIVMLKAPGGVWGWIQQRFHLQLFPVSRHLTVAPTFASRQDA